MVRKKKTLDKEHKEWWEQNKSEVDRIFRIYCEKCNKILLKDIPEDKKNDEINQIKREYTDLFSKEFPGKLGFLIFPKRTPKTGEFSWASQPAPIFFACDTDPTHLKMQECPQCGREFFKNFEKFNYCSQDCYDKHESRLAAIRVTRKRLLIREAKLGNSLKHNKICEVCGKSFESLRSDARYCSDSCRKRKYRLNKKLRL